MKIFKTALLLIVMISGNNAVAAKTAKARVYTVEGPVVAFYLGKDLTGYIKAKTCETCKVAMFKITPDVIATLDGKELPLSNFILSSHKPGAAHFNTKTGKMLGLVWFSHKR